MTQEAVASSAWAKEQNCASWVVGMIVLTMEECVSKFLKGECGAAWGGVEMAGYGGEGRVLGA